MFSKSVEATKLLHEVDKDEKQRKIANINIYKEKVPYKTDININSSMNEINTKFQIFLSLFLNEKMSMTKILKIRSDIKDDKKYFSTKIDNFFFTTGENKNSYLKKIVKDSYNIIDSLKNENYINLETQEREEDKIKYNNALYITIIDNEIKELIADKSINTKIKQKKIAIYTRLLTYNYKQVKKIILIKNEDVMSEFKYNDEIDDLLYISNKVQEQINNKKKMNNEKKTQVVLTEKEIKIREKTKLTRNITQKKREIQSLDEEIKSLEEKYKINYNEFTRYRNKKI